MPKVEGDAFGMMPVGIVPVSWGCLQVGWRSRCGAIVKSLEYKKREAASAIVFSSDESQTEVKVKSNEAAIIRNLRNTFIVVGDRLDRAFNAATIAWLSTWKTTWAPLNSSPQRRTDSRTASSSLAWMSAPRRRRGARDENQWFRNVPPSPFDPLASV